MKLLQTICGAIWAAIIFAMPCEAASSPPIMAVPGQLTVSSTGAATYSIPITVPPGTAGLVPTLSLSYSSQNGDGLVGLGWALNGLPSITRCPRTIAQDNGVHGSVNYDAGDRFCLDGQRLMVTSGVYGADGSEYSTEIESFSKIVAHGSAGVGPAWFEVHTKAGQIIEFGHTVDSQVLVVSAATLTPTSTARVWAANKISDVVGNYMAITYNCTEVAGVCTEADRTVNGEVYPLRIDYTGNASAGVNPYNSVRFNYASRADVTPLYQAGGVVKTTVILISLKTYQSANVVLDYRLSFRMGTNAVRSRLTSLNQCDAGGACLPAMTFSWQGGESFLSVSESSSAYTSGNPTIIPSDFNGDGLTDEAVVALFCPSSGQFPVYLGQSSFGFAPTTAYWLPVPNISPYDYCNSGGVVGTTLAPDGTSQVILDILARYNPPHPPPVNKWFVSSVTTAGAFFLSGNTTPFLTPAPIAPGDYNGDGIPDYFLVESPTSNIYLGNLTGGFNSPAAFWTGLDYSSSSVQGGDFDGDGCADFWAQEPDALINTIYYASAFCNPSIAQGSAPYIPDPSVLGDFNGDGKTDIFVPATGVLYLSTGKGFFGINSAPGSWIVKGIGDWNGDGKADVLVDDGSGSDYKLYLSTGSGFAQAVDVNGNPIIISGSAGGTAIVADWSSAGNSDILIQQPNSGDFFVLSAYAPEVMISVSNGVGSTTFISYDRINQNGSFYQKCSNGTYSCGDAYPTQAMDGPQYVVREVDASNGLGTCAGPGGVNCYQAKYTYGGAKKDLQGRGFLGFQQVAINDPQTGITQTTNYSIAFPYVGLVTSQTKTHGSVTLSSVTNTYATNSACGATPAGSGVYVDCLTQSIAASNDLNGTAFPTTTTSYTYDNYGNALTTNASVSDGSSKNTTNTYSNDTANWFLGRLLTTSVHSMVGSSNLTRQSSFAYDAATGLLTQESIEPGDSACNGGASSCTLTTSYTYDVFGHRVTSTVFGSGIATRTSYAFYDPAGQFQTSAANALGQYEFWTYDPAFGGPTSHTGPNLLKTNWAYDNFGRLTLETRPDGTKTAQSYGYCAGGCPAYGQFYAQSEPLAPDGVTQVGPISTSTYDMLSRSIAGDAQGFSGNNIRVATIYDGNGRVQQTSRPYFTGNASPAWTQYIYDDLGRPTRATLPDTSHTDYGYNGLTTTVTNNLGQVTTTVKNAQGLNYQVTDATSHTTSYLYDAFGDLLTVTDPLGHVITNRYDIRGNKYASSDPDMDDWSYAYDVLSELVSQTDAKGQATALTYDVLGRALSRTEPGLYSAWTYGDTTSSHNVGQLIEAKACAAPGCATLVSNKTYTYDSLGRQISSVLQTATDYFGYGTAYDAINGQIASVTYPSGYVVNRAYNSQGYLTRLIGATGDPIWTINARDAELHLTSQTAGNGVVTTQAFDPLTGLLQNQRAGPGAAIASFDYAFDSIGNLSTRTDNSQPFTERFCYDSLNRLTKYNIGASCMGGSAASYDAIGNITSKSDAGSYSYGGAGPHAVSAITGTVDGLVNPKYSYDANGNLTCVSSGAACSGTVGRTVGLTSFNMAASMIQGANSLELTYDDQHQRIQQVNTVSGTATTTTVYLNDAASGAMSERVTAAGTTPTVWNGFAWGAALWGGVTANSQPTWVDYITIDGQVVAQRSVQYPAATSWGQPKWGAFNWGLPPGTPWGGFNWGAANWSGPVVKWEYFNLDHLGSVAVITDQGGNVVQRLSYDAWGKQRNANGTAATCGAIASTTTKGFTNQEQMPTACLVNLNARLYDPSIGKFMAADSIVPNAFDGQSYNRYAYVTNNPLSFTDPSGHDYGGGVESVTVSANTSSFQITGNLAALAGAGGGTGDADPALQRSTPVRPPPTESQENQITKTYFPPNSCSRASGRANSVCGGSYAVSITVTVNSSAKKTASYANAQSVPYDPGSDSDASSDGTNGAPLNQFAGPGASPPGIGGGPGPSFDPLVNAANEAFKANPPNISNYLPPLSWLRGIRIHSYFASEVNSMEGYAAEVSYKNGLIVPYGTLGSVRADAVYGPVEAPVYAVELKSGMTTATPAEMRAYQANLPPGTPVYQINENLGR